MARLLSSVDPCSIGFLPPQKCGPIYIMRPNAPLVLQTPPVTCTQALGPKDRKLHVLLDPVTEAWLRSFEASFAAYAKANTRQLFNKDLDADFIDESFRSILPPPGAKSPVALAITDDAAVFNYNKEQLTRDAVPAGASLNLLLEVACIQFGKKWFTPKLRVVSLRIPPPPPPPPATPTYESLGWVDDAAGDAQQAVEADDDDAVSIDIDLDELAPAEVPPPQHELAASVGPPALPEDLSLAIEDV